jgi:hypothetical protein
LIFQRKNKDYCDGSLARRPFISAAACILSVLMVLMLVSPDTFAAEVASSYNSTTSITAEENSSGSAIELDLPTGDDFKYIRTSFMNSDGELESVTNQAVSHGTAEVSTSDLEDGTYYLQISKSSDNRSYTEIVSGKSGFIVKVSDGAAEIRQSPVLYQYLQYYNNKDTSVEALYYYLKPSSDVQSTDSGIVQKASEITSGITGAYAKAEAICDWVSSNIYYDVDYDPDTSSSSEKPASDALSTLKTGYAVCEGYANLTTALLRAAGIPARTCVGYGLIDSDEEWSEYKAAGYAGMNHAWTEAYLRGRWIEIDTTWNSRNVFYKGSGISGKAVDTYFDNTPQFFAYGHLQLKADDFSTSYIKMLFADLNEDDWSYKYIRFAVNNDIMHGNGDGTFRPDDDTTQAMFITMLSFAAGENISPATTGNWYDPFDEWAVSAGITDGVEGYDPAGLISREQMAVMLHNFIEYEGFNPTSDSSDTFSDIEDADEWARDDITDLKRWGFLAGRGDGKFYPQDTFTRAEAAVIITLVDDTILRNYLNT